MNLKIEELCPELMWAPKTIQLCGHTYIILQYQRKLVFARAWSMHALVFWIRSRWVRYISCSKVSKSYSAKYRMGSQDPKGPLKELVVYM